MTEETQKETRTLYLMYKIAVRDGDREEATRCIEAISKAPEPLEYLYACCLDAQEAPHRAFAIEALNKLLEKNAHSPSSPVHLPALLRCTIRLMVKDLEGLEDETDHQEAVQRLSGVFNEGESLVALHHLPLTSLRHSRGQRTTRSKRRQRQQALPHQRAGLVRPKRLQPRPQAP
jgi:hypothetical protein